MVSISSHLCVGPVAFHEGAAQGSDTLLNHHLLIRATTLFPQRHNERLVQVSHQVELRVAFTGEAVECLGNGALGARSTPPVPLGDFKRLVLAVVDVDVLLTV